MKPLSQWHVLKATKYSLDGIGYAVRETAVKQLIALHTTLIILSFVISLDTPTRMILIAASFFSLIVEFFNTAIEAAVDHTSTEKHPLAKQAKDIASAAQMLTLTMIAILWGIALFS